MSNIKKVQCSKCGIWIIPEESVHSLYNSGECKVTCLDCAPSGRTISPDAIKGGREMLENISKLFANLDMTQYDRRFNFGPASPNENIVYGAQRPGYNFEYIAFAEVQEWVNFMKEQNIRRICCLLPENQLKFYDDINLLKFYRDEFGKDNICLAGIEDFHLCEEVTLKEIILPFLKESEQKGEKVVVHCSGGSGRTGHVLAAWLVHRHGFSVEEAKSTVKRMGREPREAVFSGNATEDELNTLLEACKCSSLYWINIFLQNLLKYIENKDISNAIIMAKRIIRKSHSLPLDILYAEPNIDKETLKELARRVKKLRGKSSVDYLFCWDDIPGNDNERLIGFLKGEFNIGWINTIKIEKLYGDETIRVYFDDNYIYLRLNDKRTKVDLEIADVRTEQLFVKHENNNLGIYYGDSIKEQLYFWITKIENHCQRGNRATD